MFVTDSARDYVDDVAVREGEGAKGWEGRLAVWIIDEFPVSVEMDVRCLK